MESYENYDDGVVSCYDCSHQVSKIAKACPHCGRPKPQMSLEAWHTKWKKEIIANFIILPIIVCVFWIPVLSTFGFIIYKIVKRVMYNFSTKRV